MNSDNSNIIRYVIDTTGLSIEQLAKLLDVSRQTINNYENNPGQIPLDKIQKLASETGISIDALLSTNEKLNGPVIKSTYEKYNKKINGIIAESRSIVKELNELQIDNNLYSCHEAKYQAKSDFEGLSKITSIKGRKPIICTFGPSDTGKSTLINFLLRNNTSKSDDVVPTGYSPLTSVPTYLKHINEKPNFLNDILKNPSDNAVVIGREKGKGKEPLRHDLLTPEEFKAHILRSGNYKSILREFGTRDGEFYKNNYWEIDEIIVYVDNNLLKEVTLIDIPGFGSGNKRDDIGLTMDASSFDVIFFLSTLNAYLRESELTALSNILRMRKDLSSFYLIGTHASVLKTPNEIEKRIHSGCEILVSTLSENEKNRLHLSENDFSSLEKRCFAFDTNSKKYCNELNNALENELPNIIDERLSETVTEAKSALEELKNKYSELIKEIDGRRLPKSAEEIKTQKEESKKALQEALRKIDASKNKLKKSVKEKKHFCSSRFEDKYKDVINTHHIKHLIERKHIKNKKYDLNKLSNYLSNELNDKFSDLLKNESEHFATELSDELQDHQTYINQKVDKVHFYSNLIDFDVERAFAAGLAGATTYGALAIWASIVAGGSNLGAYILVAKVVSALSAIGISVGGTAAAVSFVASIGGPVTIGIALAALAAITAWGIFTGSWEKRAAKKMRDSYNNNHVLEKLCEKSDEYWNATDDSLDKCFSSLSENVKRYYESQEQIDGIDIEDYVRMTTIMKMIYSKCVSGCTSILNILNETEM